MSNHIGHDHLTFVALIRGGFFVLCHVTSNETLILAFLKHGHIKHGPCQKDPYLLVCCGYCQHNNVH